MSIMIRTQVYLSQDLYNQLLIIARQESLPLAKIIRSALTKGLKTNLRKNNDLLELADLKITGGPKDLSGNLDRYLYGLK